MNSFSEVTTFLEDFPGEALGGMVFGQSGTQSMDLVKKQVRIEDLDKESSTALPGSLLQIESSEFEVLFKQYQAADSDEEIEKQVFEELYKLMKDAPLLVLECIELRLRKDLNNNKREEFLGEVIAFVAKLPSMTDAGKRLAIFKMALKHDSYYLRYGVVMSAFKSDALAMYSDLQTAERREKNLFLKKAMQKLLAEIPINEG
jgi:hypothetical protein